MDVIKKHSERWKISEENARSTIKRGQPYEMFLCVVDQKYKRTIWNKELKALKREPSLFNDEIS